MRILEHSRRVFHSEGFHKISMDELSRGLGISKKTIYKHFPSKDKLVEQICAQTSEVITGEIDNIVDSKTDVVEKFVRIMNLYGDFAMNIGEKWLKDLSMHAPREAARIDEKRRAKIHDILTRLIRQGKKERLIENFPVPVIINTFTAAVASIMNPDFLLKNKLSVHQAFSATYNFLLSGLLTAKGKEKLKKTKALYGRKN